MAIHTIQVPITGDTYVQKTTPNTNYGSSAELISYYEFGSHSVAERCAILLKWNPNSIPERKRILSAELFVYLLTSSGTDGIVAVSPVDFSEYSVTYNSIPESHWEQGGMVVFEGHSANQYVSEASRTKGIGLTSFNFSVGKMALVKYRSKEFFKIASRESNNPPYWEVVYEDVPPDKPTLISPIGTYEDNKNIIRFQWQYNSSVGGEQKKFDLQWSSNNGLTWTTVSQATSNNYYNMPADTLLAGNILWRVRTYNEYDEASEYSDTAAFFAVGVPAEPIVTVENTSSARPVVKWTAQGQQIYQVQILKGSDIVYDTGDMPSLTIFEHKVRKFLSDGDYVARVRTKNEYGIWTSWATASFTINTTKPIKPSHTLYANNAGITIMFSNIDANADYIIIYRDNIPIAKIEASALQYRDFAVANKKEYKYFIRVVTFDETFNDSDLKIGATDFDYNYIASINDLSDVILLKYTSTPNNKQGRISFSGKQKYYVGRKYAVYEYDEHSSHTLAVSFVIDSDKFDKIVNLLEQKKTFLFRDSSSRKIYGTATDFEFKEHLQGIEVSFIINKNDYTEEIEV